MQRKRAVFNTDQVNRAGMICPARELMRGEEKHHRQALRWGTEPGAPSNIQHDMHRPFGWSRPLGLYIDSTMVRHLGMIECAETEQEEADLRGKWARYWSQFHREGTEPYREDLITRASPLSPEDLHFLQIEAAVATRPGVAADLYPDLFTPSTALVDKDGLVDYRQLIERMKQVQPGIFHDLDRDVLIFADRMFRRSHSHLNKFNEYFLQSFHAASKEYPHLRVRIRLDPDLIGHPRSARNLIELEYWHGPIYSDDIAKIPTGVAEHKADDRSRFFEGIDRTQVWWKDPERRIVDGRTVRYRTFEVEELVENPSQGLSADRYGCRYAHAEYSLEQEAITHFDGAIRAYASDPYFQRIDKSIDRAGKQSDYTKLFRFDGELPVAGWKRLLSDFFRGNKLIPEYLGAPTVVDDDDGPEAAESNIPTASDAALSALICLDRGSLDSGMTLCADLCQELEGELVPYVEVGTGCVEKYLRSRIDFSEITTVGIRDTILNLSRLSFGTPNNLKEMFAVEVTALALSLREDIDSGTVLRASIPMIWEMGQLLVTLTIAGDAAKVANVLTKIPSLVDPTEPPSQWIEALSALINATTPRENSPVMWHGVSRGVLAIQRFGEVEIQMRLPDALIQQLKDKGKLKQET